MAIEDVGERFYVMLRTDGRYKPVCVMASCMVSCVRVFPLPHHVAAASA